MRAILATILCAVASACSGANPDYRAFRGSGGISIVSNPPTGLIIFDGSGIFTSSGTNATIAISTNGVLVMVAATNVNFVMGTNMLLTATNIGSTAHVGIHGVINPGDIGDALNVFLLTDILPVLVVDNATITNLGSSPPISSVQYNSNGITRGSQNFVFTNNLVGIGPAIIPTNRLDVSGHTSLRSNLFLASLPTNGSPIAFLAVDAAGAVYETALTTGGGGTVSVSVNGTSVSVVATQVNLVQGLGIELLSTNSPAGLVSVGIANKHSSVLSNFILAAGIALPAPPFASLQFNSNGVMKGSASALLTNGIVYLANVPVFAQGAEITANSLVFNGGTTALAAWNGLGRIRWDSDGVMRLENDTGLSFNRINLGPNGEGSPALGATNGDAMILGGDGEFDSGGTNRLIVPGGVVVTSSKAFGTPQIRMGQEPTGQYWDFVAGSNPETYFLGLKQSANDNYVMVWELGGNIGIGTTNPTTRLDVLGRATLRSNVFLPNIATTVSPFAFLATDAAGEVFETAVPTASTVTNALVQTNGVDVGSIGTINWTAGVTGSISGTVVTIGVVSATTVTNAALTNAVATGLITNVVNNFTNAAAGLVGLLGSTNNGNVRVKGLVAGSNILLTDNTTNVAIGGGVLLNNFFAMGISNITNFGSGIAIRTNGGTLTISNTQSGEITVSGHSNAIPFINGAGNAFRYIETAGGFGSLTNPGFGFNPITSGGPHGGYGGLMVFANESMGLLTVGHPNPGSDFATFTTALAISNRYNSAADFKNDMIKFDAVMIGGGLRSDSTLTRWRVWQAAASSNDVAEINLNGQIKLYGGTLYRSNTVALPTAAELGAGGYWVGVSNNAAANTLVSIYSTDGTTTIMKHLVP